MYTTSRFSFKYENLDAQLSLPNSSVTVELYGDQTRDELISQFEVFLLASGYLLPKGATLGYEYEDDLSVGFSNENNEVNEVLE